MQLGANCDLYFGFSDFCLTGYLGFDALFRFSPFYFIIEVVFGILTNSLALLAELYGTTTPPHLSYMGTMRPDIVQSVRNARIAREKKELQAELAGLAASKAANDGPAMSAVEALTRGLSAELAPRGVRVIGLRPTGMPESGTIKEVFGIIPFSSQSLTLRPIKTGVNPLLFELPFSSVTNSVIKRNSKFSFTPYFHNVEGKLNVLVCASFF